MNAKRIVFIIMCIFLVATVAVAGIVVWRAVDLFGSLGSLLNPSLGQTQTSAPTDAPTDPPTDPPTQPPTEPPTQPPTQPPHVHEWKASKVQKPSCEVGGYTIYSCSCGETKVDNFKDSLGHNWDGGTVVAPTCEVEGYTRYRCSRCKRTENRNWVDKLGHDMSVVRQQPATCTQDAKTVTSCAHSGCTRKIEEITTGSALGHIWGPEQRVEATCTEDGHVLIECTNNGCNEEKRETLPATGHSFGVWQDAAGGHKETTCGNQNCGVTVSSADLKITKQYSADTTHYTVEVGTDAVAVVLTYHVVDGRAEELRSSHPLAISYDAVNGFCVTYEKAAGGEETKTLDALQGGSLLIEDAPVAEENTEPGTTEAPEQ